jgi:serine/threonine-protein kinase
MGGLWLARDEVLGRQVAVKVLHDHLADDDELLERFRMEAVAAARLSHPAVVRVFDTGVHEGVCFIVMELVEGRSVEDVLAERGALRPAEAARIVRGVLQALSHAHRQEVIHRDVKPGNILMGRDGAVKLADFGIAKTAFTAGDLTTTGNLLGTSRYLSPEQVTGGEVDPRSDLYAAGVVLYELLTGRPPFDAETHIATATMRLTVDPPPPGSLRPGIPRALEAVVMRALAREPGDRYQTADEMRAALERAAPSEVPSPTPPPQEDLSPRRSYRSWIAIPIVLVILGGLAVGAFLLLEGIRKSPDQPRAGGPRTAQPLELIDARSYDPEAGDGENEDSLANAIDGNEETMWTTEGYFSPDVGGKAGVGLVLELAEESEVGALALETELGGWEFSVYAGDGPTSFDMSADLGGPFEAEDGQTYDIDPTETSYVLVWITDVAPAEEGKWRAVVNEIELRSRGD